MKIIFAGTSEFSRESIEALYNAKHEILAVVTKADKPKGRGMKTIATPVKEYALQKNIKVYEPETIKDNVEFITEIRDLNPELIVVVSYGKILPKEMLEIPKKGCVNLHVSSLPKYRGSAPVQWAIMNGDSETGVTTMYMDEGLDTGDIILTRKVKIYEDETSGELLGRMQTVGAEILVETVDLIGKGKAPREKQGKDFTIAPMIEKEMAKIDWEEKSAKEIKNLVRGLNPFLGAYSVLGEKKYKFWKVKVVESEELCQIIPGLREYVYRLKAVEPGTIIYVDDRKGLYIKAKDEAISVLEIQGENAKRMDIGDFLRGSKLQAMQKFS